jgi:hypothetical protein
LLTESPIYDYLTAKGYKTEKEDIHMEGWPVQFLPPDAALGSDARPFFLIAFAGCFT